jgi:hypothetical protein
VVEILGARRNHRAGPESNSARAGRPADGQPAGEDQDPAQPDVLRLALSDRKSSPDLDPHRLRQALTPLSAWARSRTGRPRSAAGPARSSAELSDRRAATHLLAGERGGGEHCLSTVKRRTRCVSQQVDDKGVGGPVACEQRKPDTMPDARAIAFPAACWANTATELTDPSSGSQVAVTGTLMATRPVTVGVNRLNAGLSGSACCVRASSVPD